MRSNNLDRWFRQVDFDPSDLIPSSQRSSNDVLPSLAIFSAGLLVGIGTALMLAPKPGAEIRRDVVRSANKLGHDLRESIPTLTDPSTAEDSEGANRA